MSDEAIESILDDLRGEICRTLGARLTGLYLYGSYVTGGSLPGVSDLDLLAAIDGDLVPHDVDQLRAMHASFVERHPEWDDRVEVAYLSTAALASFKEQRSQIAVISPGEPLHVREERAGADWLMNWHLVRTGGRTLLGQAPAEIIAATTHEEFVESLREHVRTGEPWMTSASSRKAVSYVVLTLCRTLVAIETGRHSSKSDAAAWVERTYPQWTPLIDTAMAARTDPAGSLPAEPQTVAAMRAMFAFVRAWV